MTVQTQTVQYAIDPKVSQFTVQAFANGLISAVAHSPKIAIRDWSGTATFMPETLRDARVSATIKTSSLEVLDEMSASDERELRRVMNDVLEVKRFPEILFDCSLITADRQKEFVYRVNLEGNLTLHGCTNHLAFFSQVAFGVDTFRAHGEFTLLQTDYEMKIASIAGGTLKLQDELKFRFYFVGRKLN
jgi:polyisoprenoid-binding protein YceI